MLARFCVRAGTVLLGDRPPDGRAYWAARAWDRDAVTSTPGLSAHFDRHRQVAEDLIGTHAAGAREVLEIACGTGEFTELAARMLPGARVTGVDISAQALAQADSRLGRAGLAPGVRLVRGDFHAELPGVPAAADVVLCFDAIHHLGDPDLTLRRLRARLAPGGVLIGNIWTADHFHEFGRHRYGPAGHLRRCAGFLAAAAVIRVTGGRVGCGVYRTRLITIAGAEALLGQVFSRTETVRLRYHLAFAAWP
jgi:ubiquinone/menaquinone biosynthesis C-methylase UbiE